MLKNKNRIYHIISFFIVLIILFPTNNAIAQTDNIRNEFNEMLAKYSNENKTIVSEFELVKNIKQLKRSVKSSGDFYYTNNGAMALLYNNPAGDKIIIKDGIFYIVVGGKLSTTQSKSNPMLEQITQMMNACMRGEVAELGRGWESEYKIQEGNYNIELIPTDKRTKRYLSSIILDFEKSNLSLNKMIINESSGNNTTYLFKNKKFNTPIDTSKFDL